MIRSILRIDRPTEGDNGAYQCKFRLSQIKPVSQLLSAQFRGAGSASRFNHSSDHRKRRKLVSAKVVVASNFPPRTVRRKYNMVKQMDLPEQ